MSEHINATAPPFEIPGFPSGSSDEIKTDRKVLLQAGGKLYGVCSDIAHVARAVAGEQVLSVPDWKSA